MKYRSSFVANSSSCSFVIELSKCTEKQLNAVYDHWNYATERQWYDIVSTNRGSRLTDQWEIYLFLKGKKTYMNVQTSMDNFDMYTFCSRIGIPEDAISELSHSNGTEWMTYGE